MKTSSMVFCLCNMTEVGGRCLPLKKLELHVHLLTFCYQYQLLLLTCCLVSPLSMMTLVQNADQYGPS